MRPNRVALILSVVSAALAAAAAVTSVFQAIDSHHQALAAEQTAADAHQQTQDAHRQAQDAHQLLRLQFASAVSFEINTREEDHHLGIGIANAGPGVAIVKSITYYLDGKPTDTLDIELDKRGVDTNRDSGVILEPGDTIGPGRVRWVIDYRAKNSKDEDFLAEVISDHIQVAVEFCDANEKCARLCSERKGCNKD